MKQVVGLDLGFGAFKIYTADASGVVVSHVSEARVGDAGLSAIGVNIDPTTQVITNHIGKYYVGLGAAKLGRVNSRLDYDRLTGAPEMRALLYASLGKIGPTYKDTIGLIVGVPVGFVMGDADEVKARVRAAKDWLIAEHSWLDGKRERTATVSSVSIISQAQAAYIDYSHDSTGEPIDENVDGEIGVVSIGHNTVELLAMSDGEPVRRFMFGEKAGVRRLLETVNIALGGSYDIAELDARLRAGKLDIKNGLESWSSEIAGVIERGFNGASGRFRKVVAVGGGVRFVQPTLKRLFGSRLVVPDDAVMSIARGLHKFGLQQ